MECDWEIEIASDAPVIDTAWEGFVDLRRDPSRIKSLSETTRFPALAEALINLNSAASPVWTTKCDVWQVDTVDPDELEAEADKALSALGCYIDLLPAAVQTSLADTDPIPGAISNWCRRLCLDLRTRPLRQCRVDAIIRRAIFASVAGGPNEGLGITAYITTCGQSQSEASAVLAMALAVLAKSVFVAGRLE